MLLDRPGAPGGDGGASLFSGTRCLKQSIDWWSSATREYPLTPELLAVTHVWRVAAEERPAGAPEGPPPGTLVVATKGAPEAVFDLCHLEETALRLWSDRAESMARDGLRVLGVARSTGRVTESPGNPHDLGFEMLGLVGMLDPVRADVPEAVALCRRARIRILMITGDHPDTARAIARDSGIDSEHVITGPEIEAMSDAELTTALENASIVARPVPAQKLRIVRSLRARGLIAGMTGDGVNDAPALKAADIGIAMGARGTDVARETAGLVLVNDDFGAIVQAVRIGRRIYDNLQKAIAREPDRFEGGIGGGDRTAEDNVAVSENFVLDHASMPL